MPEAIPLNPKYDSWVHLDINNAKSSNLVSLDLSSQAGEYFFEVGDYYDQTGDPEVAFDHAEEEMTPQYDSPWNTFTTPLELWEAISESLLVPLTDDIWGKIERCSTSSSKQIAYKDAMDYARSYPNSSDAMRRLEKIMVGIAQNDPIPAAVLLNHGGRYFIVSGNRRLIASKYHGCRPSVQIVKT